MRTPLTFALAPLTQPSSAPRHSQCGRSSASGTQCCSMDAVPVLPAAATKYMGSPAGSSAGITWTPLGGRKLASQHHSSSPSSSTQHSASSSPMVKPPAPPSKWTRSPSSALARMSVPRYAVLTSFTTWRHPSFLRSSTSLTASLR